MSWKAVWRRCQACNVVRPAVEFRRAAASKTRLVGSTNLGPDRLSRCPKCGHIAPYWSFLQVEPPTEDEEAE